MGIAEMMSYLERAYQADIENRREFIPNLSPQRAATAAKDIEEGVVYEQNAVRVTAFKVKHANLANAFGFRVDYRGHAVVISGDMQRAVGVQLPAGHRSPPELPSLSHNHARIEAKLAENKKTCESGLHRELRSSRWHAHE